MKNASSRPIIALGLAAFVLALLVVLPARWLGGFLPEQARCAALHGSIWNGRCDKLTLTDGRNPPLVLDEVRWQWQPTALLRGALSADVQLAQARGNARAHVQRKFSGNLLISDLAVTGTLDHSVLSVLPAGWAGQLDARDISLELRAGKLLALRGRGQVQDFTDGRGSRYGNYELDFPPQTAAPFSGRLRDQGGPIDLAAQVTIAANLDWEVNGTIAPRGPPSAQLTSMLQTLGGVDAKGRSPLSVAGSFK